MDVPQQLRNADLAKWDSEYLSNMASAYLSRQSNKSITQAKKNAASWVFGHGIGSVGLGLGVSRITHPLHYFSGEHLLAALHKQKEHNAGQKRSYKHVNENDSGDDGRRVRARDKGGYEETIGRGEIPAEIDGQVQEVWMHTVLLFCTASSYGTESHMFVYQDVEIGRHAPPSLHDDASSQMPWNTTASIQGSRYGSSAPSLPRPFESVDSSSHRQLGGLGRIGHRFASSSPLANRGLPFDPSRRDRPSLFSIFGSESDDLDTLGGYTLDSYYGEERVEDAAGTEPEGEGNQALIRPNTLDAQTVAALQLRVSTLDQDSRNFLEFVHNGVSSIGQEPAEDAVISSNEITFSHLLPPETTSCMVATQGLMHILTLATMDILAVRQVSTGVPGYTNGHDTFGDIILSVKVAFD
jgi:meiotic recombination protein REC8, fungi type